MGGRARGNDGEDGGAINKLLSSPNHRLSAAGSIGGGPFQSPSNRIHAAKNAQGAPSEASSFSIKPSISPLREYDYIAALLSSCSTL